MPCIQAGINSHQGTYFTHAWWTRTPSMGEMRQEGVGEFTAQSGHNSLTGYTIDLDTGSLPHVSPEQVNSPTPSFLPLRELLFVTGLADWGDCGRRASIKRWFWIVSIWFPRPTESPMRIHTPRCTSQEVWTPKLQPCYGQFCLKITLQFYQEKMESQLQ